jgi:transcriptional regulator with XRE-family HTH domain
VSAVLPELAKSRGFNQAQLEEATQIGHSTMSGYWSGRLTLGLGNARKIAAVLKVDLSELGYQENPAAPAQVEVSRLIAQVEDVLERGGSEVGAILRLLARRLDALELAVAQSGRSTRPGRRR